MYFFILEGFMGLGVLLYDFHYFGRGILSQDIHNLLGYTPPKELRLRTPHRISSIVKIPVHSFILLPSH
jgi:hypothetical protein